MDPLEIIKEYYKPGSRIYGLLVQHSQCVAEKALAVAATVGHLKPDLTFIHEAAILHDIGIFLTRSPSLGCFGEHPYVCHGVLGRELLEKHGLPRHALVCERHVGTGLTLADIDRQHLPLPRRDMRPVSIEEQIICYADKFFSKDGKDPGQEKSVREVLQKLASYGPEPAARFRSWVALFDGTPDTTQPRPQTERFT